MHIRTQLLKKWVSPDPEKTHRIYPLIEALLLYISHKTFSFQLFIIFSYEFFCYSVSIVYSSLDVF